MGTQLLEPCPLCRQVKPSSFEHIPPESCDNDTAAVAYTLEQLLLKPESRGRIMQRGHGYDSLCKTCNSHLGTRYNRAFADWEAACRAAKTVAGAEVEGTFFPLRVLKGILGMFLSSHPELGEVEAVRDYLMKPESTAWPEPCKLFAFSRQGTVLRSTGGFMLMGYGGEIYAMAEVHTSAMGYVLSFDGQCWSPSYTDLTGFSSFSYDEPNTFRAFFWPLCVDTEIPGDYRNQLMIAEGFDYRPFCMGVSGLGSRVFNKREFSDS